MKFKYIGLKVDGERAFQEKTGIEWMPGAVHNVTDDAVAAEMAQHPTIWEAQGDTTTLADAKQPLRSSGPATDEEVDQEIDAKAAAAKTQAAQDSANAVTEAASAAPVVVDKPEAAPKPVAKKTTAKTTKK